MIFSLIVPTIRRTVELDRLLASLASQKSTGWDLGRDLEVLVVDQNDDDRLVKVLDPYRSRIVLVHMKAPPLGQSHAKNLGLQKIQGEYVAFPDDDCYYSEDTLDIVLRSFRETGDRSVLFGRGVDFESGAPLLKYPSRTFSIQRRKDPKAFLGLQIAQFYTRDMVREIGDFDVDLCSGGKWGSGEETDYALRALQAGHPIEFRPEIIVYHPLLTPNSVDLDKLRHYSIGYGALCRKQGLHGLLFFKTVKQFFGSFVFFMFLNFKKAKVSWITATARLRGFGAYGIERKGARA